MLQPVARVAIKYGNQTENTRQANKELGKDEFLQLLTQQLKYQDPLSPMDNQDFIAQMAQFSSLEQSKNMNENLENFLTVSALNEQRFQAISLIGKKVSGLDVNGQDVLGVVDSVRFENGLPVLMVEKQEIMLSEIGRISSGDSN